MGDGEVLAQELELSHVRRWQDQGIIRSESEMTTGAEVVLTHIAAGQTATIEADIDTAGIGLSNFTLLGGIDLSVTTVSDAARPALCPRFIRVCRGAVARQGDSAIATVALLIAIQDAVAATLVGRTVGAAAIPRLEVAVVTSFTGANNPVAALIDDAHA
jgi:hypothetical protein